MKVLSLFSGIGAFEKALKNLGIEVDLVNFCEIDKFAAQSYSMVHDVPLEKNLGDITKVDTSKLPSDIDLITYGFPCQDISNAGKQKGFEHDGERTRSGLFFEALRIIEDTQPRIAIAENVKNLTSKKFKNEFETVLNSLENAGYNNYYQVLNAKNYGIPQNRERVFIISIRKDIDAGLFSFPQPFPLELRLKDMLEDEVDEKYCVSKKVQERLVITDPTFTKNVIGTTKLPQTTIGQREMVYNPDGVVGCLTATDYKHPKQIAEPKIQQIGNVAPTGNWSNPQRGRVYSAEGLCPTLNTMQGGGLEPKILVREGTKKGYAVAEMGDSVNLDYPGSLARRGRVGKGVAQTLTTSCNQAVVEPSYNGVLKGTSYARNFGSKGKMQDVDGVCGTLLSAMGTGGGNVPIVQEQLRIRKLTPLECWRLMGFTDEDFYKVKGISNSQLYKQAGNSIVVNVLVEIFRELSVKVSYE